MRKFLLSSIALMMVLSVISCHEDSKREEIIRRSTELAKQRTDSFLVVQKESLERVKVIERHRADSLRRVDSLRRIYERNHFTISGKVGESSASLTVHRSNDVGGVTGTFNCDGNRVNVSGTYNNGINASGTQRIDSTSTLKVTIRLSQEENDFSGTVTFNRDGSTYSRQAILHRY